AVLHREVACGGDAFFVHCLWVLAATVDAFGRGVDHDVDLRLVAEPGFLARHRERVPTLGRGDLHEVWTTCEGDLAGSDHEERNQNRRRHYESHGLGHVVPPNG